MRILCAVVFFIASCREVDPAIEAEQREDLKLISTLKEMQSPENLEEQIELIEIFRSEVSDYGLRFYNSQGEFLAIDENFSLKDVSVIQVSPKGFDDFRIKPKGVEVVQLLMGE